MKYRRIQSEKCHDSYATVNTKKISFYLWSAYPDQKYIINGAPLQRNPPW